MYGETFDIPAPDELIFISSFTGGEVFRSGCTFRRGHGKIFFFSPGDQDYPVYHHHGRPPGDRQRRRSGSTGATVRADRCRPCCATTPTTSSTATATPGRSSSARTSMRLSETRVHADRPLRLIQVGAGVDGPKPGST